MLMSFAQEGMSPHRMVVNLRVFWPISRRTVTTGCVGAMLYRGRSSISPTAPKRSAKYGFAYVNRYLLHTCSLSQIRRVAWPRPNDVSPLCVSGHKRICFSWCYTYSSMFMVRPGCRRMAWERRLGIRPGKGMTHEPQSTASGVSTARSR